MDFGDFDKNREVKLPGITVNKDYNPFVNAPADHAKSSYANPADKNLKNWEALYNIGKEVSMPNKQEESAAQLFETSNTETFTGSFFMYGKNYIITPVKSGLMIIDMANARERIAYDKLIEVFWIR